VEAEEAAGKRRETGGGTDPFMGDGTPDAMGDDNGGEGEVVSGGECGGVSLGLLIP
jgi:hypothetical protein